jgi:endonuclease III
MPRVDRRRLALILELLEQAYGRPQWKCWGKALDVLVETILSQNTSDANSSAGYRQLRRKFRTWNAVADAPVGEVAAAIRISGLSRIKAPRIQGILREIRQEQGGCVERAQAATTSQTASEVRAGKQPKAHRGQAGIMVHGLTSPLKARRDGMSLEYLRELEPEEALQRLLRFHGVGPKTACCVLLFSLGMPLFPVDTHIHRIAIRLGLVDGKASAEDVRQRLTSLIAPSDRYAMHILLITHGRKTCRAISPRCAWCDLIKVCPEGKNRMRMSND